MPHAAARDCPCPVAGRSLRASCPSLTRCWPRFSILASLGQQRRLPGHGQPLAALLRSTGFQPVCLPGLAPRLTALGLYGISESRPAVRPRATCSGLGIWWWFAPRLTALGLYGQRVSGRTSRPAVRPRTTCTSALMLPTRRKAAPQNGTSSWAASARASLGSTPLTPPWSGPLPPESCRNERASALRKNLTSLASSRCQRRPLSR